jgi:hypothetical protein
LSSMDLAKSFQLGSSSRSSLHRFFSKRMKKAC